MKYVSEDWLLQAGPAARRIREAFDAYATFDAPALPADPISARQVHAHRTYKIDAMTAAQRAAGCVVSIMERVIESRSGDIRHSRERIFRLVYSTVNCLMVICTEYKLDFGEILRSGEVGEHFPHPVDETYIHQRIQQTHAELAGLEARLKEVRQRAWK